MNNTQKSIHLLNRLALISLKTLLVTLVLAYGGLVFFSKMDGFQLGNYRITEVYTFAQLTVDCGATKLAVQNGNLTIARRAGQKNYAILTGDIQAGWPPPIQQWQGVPPQAFRKVRISFNPADLNHLLEQNASDLQKLLDHEPEALLLKRQAQILFDRGADRLHPLLFPTLDFFRPPPPGVMDLAILDEEWGGLWTLTTGSMLRDSLSFSRIAPYGIGLGLLLIAISSILAVAAVSATALSVVLEAAIWLHAVFQSPGPWTEAPITSAFITLTILLVAGALVFLLGLF